MWCSKTPTEESLSANCSDFRLPYNLSERGRSSVSATDDIQIAQLEKNSRQPVCRKSATRVLDLVRHHHISATHCEAPSHLAQQIPHGRSSVCQVKSLTHALYSLGATPHIRAAQICSPKTPSVVTVQLREDTSERTSVGGVEVHHERRRTSRRDHGEEFRAERRLGQRPPLF